uniref:AlNc14C170G7974 protein n=1 Tax=Albugo laibachii Nc14 TaxID=890382 RepID=F0WNE7_9STRA|nr:AlNc14C170G7974 [Albugo laibachii Nc14]|eukprot:CCA22838.1 AlNc14C170G7974 [Albugo laibachii Nc14]
MIMVFHMAGLGTTEIAHMTGRCAQTIRRVIHPPPPTTCKLPGPKSLLSDRDIRRIVRAAAAGEPSAAMLKHELNISGSVRTIQRTLARVDWLEYTKMVNTLPLTAEDMLDRVAWEKSMLPLKLPMVLMDYNTIGATSAFQHVRLSEDKKAKFQSWYGVLSVPLVSQILSCWWGDTIRKTIFTQFLRIFSLLHT